MPVSATAKAETIVCAAPHAALPAERGEAVRGDARWHPAARAVTMVALGALAWVPVVAAGKLLAS